MVGGMPIELFVGFFESSQPVVYPEFMRKVSGVPTSLSMDATTFWFAHLSHDGDP